MYDLTNMFMRAAPKVAYFVLSDKGGFLSLVITAKSSSVRIFSTGDHRKYALMTCVEDIVKNVMFNVPIYTSDLRSTSETFQSGRNPHTIVPAYGLNLIKPTRSRKWR